MQQSAADAHPLGARDRNKADKQQRIREAARALFEERGYEAATMRGIATQAGVGLGAVFSYADDKRDLVFLIVNDDSHAIADRASIVKDASGAQRTGPVRATESTAHIARLIFFIYTGAVRWWIGRAEPRAEDGLRELRQLLTLQFEGCAARN
ncbi:MAG: helix-turn-helix domain-containing protein [Burkholderiales bacterium]